jgi:hypothetical protein
MARFLEGTFARINTTLSSDEDRARLIRSSVDAEIARLSQDCYSDLKCHLPGAESELDFCLNAERRAGQDRKAALAGKGVERAPPAQGPRPGKRLGRKPIRPQRKR